MIIFIMTISLEEEKNIYYHDNSPHITSNLKLLLQQLLEDT